MNNKKMHIGKQTVHNLSSKIEGSVVKLGKTNFYKISNVDHMRPFFMSIVSCSNHWMFISSNGALSAGRKDSNNALFPYYTDDKITESGEITGSKTIFQVHIDDKCFLWEPFSDRNKGAYNIRRNLYKSIYGNEIIFEEINRDLDIAFKYKWSSSNSFGFVKRSTLVNTGDKKIAVRVLDGLQNIIPYGVSEDLQNRRSNLVDAYKKSELEVDSGIGIFALSSIIVDKAEPSEALKSTIAWAEGIQNPTYLLSSLQLDNFRNGESVHQETDIKAEKGAYFICADIKLNKSEDSSWSLIANVNQSIVDIRNIATKIENTNNLASLIEKDIATGTKKLIQLVEASDGNQLAADTLRNTRHFANTMFNIMRGGIFDDNYFIEKSDFSNYLEKANKKVFAENSKHLENLNNRFLLSQLKQLAMSHKDADFKRLCIEYLPLKFSRRHGDPSRPWNKFSINTRSEIDGSKILDYEGNWRDIFQNWEALVYSHPAFIEGMIFKFLNATTFDGYNPYRVTKDGFDWEVIEPNDPWSYIGYWGDHQIIYLLKFLEIIENHYPGNLSKYATDTCFVYANVPYKIKSYAETLVNPKDTIDFDDALDARISSYKKAIGADGALLKTTEGDIYRVNLIEKLLATALAKLSNFIPEGGIWMNTQRPEWNDANNALVGNGVSMVTLCYLRRYLSFLELTISNMDLETVQISKELKTFFDGIDETFKVNINLLEGKISDLQRKKILDGVGNAGSTYREVIYKHGFSNEKSNLDKDDLIAFLQLSLGYLDHTIDANKREDHLYHAYNLMSVENEVAVSISYLPEMLEGQVAVLSSGYINANQALNVMNALKNSALFRPDQYSYLLYPNTELARFTSKNRIPLTRFENSELLQTLIQNGNREIIEMDALGEVHFNGNFNNADSLKNALDQISENSYEQLIAKERDSILELFEEVFNHKAFTGRSGTFYGYEGLGSIYWHMVSKLVLAVQEICISAINSDQDEVLIGKLLDHYYEMNEGIGVHKSPVLYGAVPTDPYSHTPAGKGAQQPGMTGQVKEDILSRFGELGVFIRKGKIQFNPRLLRREEFLKSPAIFRYINVMNESKEIALEKNSLCFTYCQIPVIYKLSNRDEIRVLFTNGTVKDYNVLEIEPAVSTLIFDRKNDIEHIEVSLK